ncbi:hypothetical protein NNN71_23305 [Kluyvera sp. Awk 3]|nr:hypothetical protein [Citrobacter portucalensis]MDA8491512.1 hypothetical protein [Kluyvera sp. Awk 3]
MFHDGNKRKALTVTAMFLARNGVQLNDSGTELEELTINAASGSGGGVLSELVMLSTSQREQAIADA